MYIAREIFISRTRGMYVHTSATQAIQDTTSASHLEKHSSRDINIISRILKAKLEKGERYKKRLISDRMKTALVPECLVFIAVLELLLHSY